MSRVTEPCIICCFNCIDVNKLLLSNCFFEINICIIKNLIHFIFFL